MAWQFNIRGNKLHLVVEGEDQGEVKNLKAAKQTGCIKVLLITKKTIRLCVEECLLPVTSVPSFVAKWKQCVDVSEEVSSEETSDDPLTPIRDESADSNEDNDVQEHHQAKFKDKLLGVYDVHVLNLIPPHKDRATRVLDYQHVDILEQSFKEEWTQVVLLAGMITTAVDPATLAQPHSASVEVLGGNHTREALQALVRKGLIVETSVKVSIYTRLTRSDCLTIDYSHNLMSERQKPMTFVDKVRLMRETMPDDNTSKGPWKDMLAVIFKAKTRRRLHASYSTHLLVAQLPEEAWTLIVRACENNTMGEKFFRPMIRIDDDRLILDSLTVLNTKGVKVFRQKVKDLIQEGHVRRKTTKERKSEQPNKTPQLHSEPETENYEEMYNELQMEFNALQEETRLLKEENHGLIAKVRALETEQEIAKEPKRRKIEDALKTKKYFKGETVEAFWRDDSGEESWLPGTVCFVYNDGKVKVQYTCDRTFSTLPASWIRKCI